eukprot:9488595-Pyramimonas_sp.AAC.2
MARSFCVHMNNLLELFLSRSSRPLPCGGLGGVLGKLTVLCPPLRARARNLAGYPNRQRTGAHPER